MNDGLVLAALKALSNETKALIMVSELEARRMPSFQLRTVFNAMIKDDDERRNIVDLIDKDLQASGYPEEQVFALLNEFLSVPSPLQMNEGVQNTRRLRSPFAHNFEGQMPVQIGAGLEPAGNGPPMMGAGQYNPRPSYAASAAESVRAPNTNVFKGVPAEAGYVPPPPTRTGAYASAVSQRAPQSQRPPARENSAMGLQAPRTQPIPRGEPPPPPANVPAPANSRYAQNAFTTPEELAALQAPSKPAGFNKNSYLPPEPAPAPQAPGLPGLPGMQPVTVRPPVQSTAPGMPLTATQQVRRFGGGESRLSPAASQQAVSEAALLTPGLANIHSPMASKIVSRTDGSPNNFQSSSHTSSVRNDGRPVILIADDDKRIRMVFRLRMEESGMNVIVCADGTEAWQRIQQGEISLAVLDMKMPGLHGLEVLSRMADKQYRIPVIVCSAYDQLKDEFVVQTYPRLRYLVKPVAPEQLVGSIKELLVKQNV